MMPVTRISDFGRLVDEFGRGPMNGHAALGGDRPTLVHRLADDIEDAAQRLRPDRHEDGRAGVHDLGAAHQAVGRVHGDGAHDVLAEMLRHLEDEALALVLGVERIEDRRQIALELHVDDGADDLGDGADGVLGHAQLPRFYRASAPEMISMSSLVIEAWRVRL